MAKGHLEQDIQTSIMNFIYSIGGLPIKQNQIGIYAQAGVPDILSCIKGRFVAIEVKIPGETPKPHQVAFLEAVIKCGGVSMWTDNLNEVKEVLKKENLL